MKKGDNVLVDIDGIQVSCQCIIATENNKSLMLVPDDGFCGVQNGLVNLLSIVRLDDRYFHIVDETEIKILSINGTKP